MKFGKFRFEFPDGVKSIKDSIAENVEEIKDRGIKNYKDVKESLEDNLGNITGKRDKKSNQQKTFPSPAKFCTSCGTAIKAGSKYCTNCGAQIGVLINNQSSDPKRGMTVNKSITKQSAPIMQSMRKSKGSQHKSAFQNNNRKEKGFFAKDKKAKIACIVAAGVCGWILMIAGIAGSDKQEADSNEPAIVLAEEATVSADESLTTERSIPLPEEDDENEIEDATESENSSNTVMASSKTTSSTSSSSTTTSSTSSSSSAVEEKENG